MNDNHEKILKALSCVPLASTGQLAALNSSLNPLKKASRLCRELEQDGHLEWQWHGKLKLWRLSRKTGKKLIKGKRRPIKNIAHTLAIGELYFTIPNIHFAFEPRYYYGKEYLEPDAMIYGVREGKKFLWSVEVQLTPLSKKRYEAKWKKYNDFYNGKHYETAAYQAWFGGKLARPSRFIVLTNQDEEQVKGGFNVEGKKLEVRASL